QASENEEYAAAYVPPSDRLHHRADRGHQRPEDHNKDAYSRVSHCVRLKECLVDPTDPSSPAWSRTRHGNTQRPSRLAAPGPVQRRVGQATSFGFVKE